MCNIYLSFINIGVRDIYPSLMLLEKNNSQAPSLKQKKSS